MYGTQHFFLSFFTVLILISPLLILTGDASLWFIPIAAGLASLMPDIDAPDSTLRHTDIRGTTRFVGRRMGQTISRFFGALLPIIKPIVEWLSYKPYCFLVKSKGGHREAFHSLYAALFTAGVFTVIFSLVLLVFNSFSLIIPAFIFIGVFLGFSLHLVEDACTRSGISFLSPYQLYYVKGEHDTDGENQLAPNTHIFVLMGLILLELAVWFFQSSVEWLQGVMMYLAQFVIVLLLFVVWLVFFAFFYKAKRSQPNIS